MLYMADEILFSLCLQDFGIFAYSARLKPRFCADATLALCPKGASNCRTRVSLRSSIIIWIPENTLKVLHDVTA